MILVFIRPRLTVMIDCTESERRRRIAARPDDNVNPWQTRSEGVAGKIREQYALHAHDLWATTDGVEPEVTARTVAHELSRMLA